MIPKTIHYFWQSDYEMPQEVKNCILSWKEKMPDYTFRCWDASNFDVDQCRYTKEAFAEKQYAFVSDYVRLYALYKEGGIYLDTDVEVLERLDALLGDKAFAGFENKHTVATSLLGAEAGHPFFAELLSSYQDRPFSLPGGKCDRTPNTVIVTEFFRKKGAVLNGRLQRVGDVVLYPQDYFSPYDRATEKMNLTAHSFAVHHFYGAWIDDGKKTLIENRKKVIRRYGKTAGYLYYSLGLIKCGGFGQFCREFKTALAQRMKG